MSNHQSLMKKTKKELVDIILRKDDVETNLSKEITRLTEQREKLTSENEELTSENKKLNLTNNEFKEAIDENASYIQEIRNNIHFWRCISFVTIGILFLICLGCIFR